MPVARKHKVFASDILKAALALLFCFVTLTNTCKDSYSALDSSNFIELLEKDSGNKSNQLEGELELEDSYFSNQTLTFQITEPRAVIFRPHFSIKFQTPSENITSPPPEA